MPRKTGRGEPPAAAPKAKAKPSKRRKTTGAAKASKEAAARTKQAERAIRAGKEPAKNTTAEEIALAERRLEALGYAEAGYDDATIGGWLDPPCSGRQARALINAALDELRAELSQTVERVRTMHLRRLESLLPPFLKRASDGNDFALTSALKIMERQAALVGADAPQRQEHTGKDGKPIEKSLTIRRVVVPISAAAGKLIDNG